MNSMYEKYAKDFHAMHTCLRGLNSLLIIYQIDRTCFPVLTCEKAAPRQDMNIKVTAFTVTNKLYNMCVKYFHNRNMGTGYLRTHLFDMQAVTPSIRCFHLL